MRQPLLIAAGFLILAAGTAFSGWAACRQRRDTEAIEARLGGLEGRLSGLGLDTCTDGSSLLALPSPADIDAVDRRLRALEEFAASASPKGSSATAVSPAELMTRLKSLSKVRLMMKLRNLIEDEDVATLTAMLASGEDVDYNGGAVITQGSIDVPPTLRVALMDALNKVGSDEARRELIRLVRESRDPNETDYGLMFLIEGDADPSYREAAVGKAVELLTGPVLPDARSGYTRNLMEACERYAIPEAIPWFIHLGRTGHFNHFAETALKRYSEEQQLQVLSAVLGDQEISDMDRQTFAMRSTNVFRNFRERRPQALALLHELLGSCPESVRGYLQHIAKSMEESR